MKKQAFNPFLPSYEYVPDGEPYVFGDRVYVFGSHDKFGGEYFCVNDYVCWSAPVDDLGNWHFDGIIYKKNQDPDNLDGKLSMFAPDIVKGKDGRFYLYYTLGMTGIMSAAVSNNFCGPYEYYGKVKYANGEIVGNKEGDVYQFDPGVFIDDDGRIYLYTGFAYSKRMLEHIKNSDDTIKNRLNEGAYCFELENDMLTIKNGPTLITAKTRDSEGSGFEGHEFFEASSIRKIDGKYYFIYSSVNGHELCYAVCDRPDGKFKYGGTIISNGDIYFNGRAPKDSLNYIGNNHGSIVKIQNEWYVFYHRQTNRHSFSRQACAERIGILPDGSIPQVEMTSCGLNCGSLSGIGRYESYIACNLYSKSGAAYIDRVGEEHPYFTQSGIDRENDGDQYIANMRDGAVAGFKYFDLRETKSVLIEICGDGDGFIEIADADGDILSTIKVAADKSITEYSGVLISNNEKAAIYFKFTGKGYIDFKAFTLK